jgi:hypothetical protein
MKKGIILIAAVLLCAVGFAQAQEGQLSGSVGVTYLSSYIWRGFDYYADDHSAIQPTVDLDLYGTGFGLNVMWSRAISAPFENAERISITLDYGDSLFESETYVTNYNVGWVYYGFPDESRSGSKTHPDAQAADMQELFLAMSWPKICPAGVVPSYTVLTMWPSEGDSAARKNTGVAHVLGIGYDLTVPGLLPETPEQVLHLSAATVYNDGVAPGVFVNTASGSVKQDWSHAVFGVSTNFNLADDLTLTPAVYYQSSWEDTVNSEDECWFTVGLAYAF